MRTSLVSVLVAGGITAVLATSPASAITFTTSSVSVTDSINQPNIGYSSTGLNANLAIGTPVTIDDFIQAGVNGNSFQSPQTETISVTLNFSTPPGASGNIDSGTIGASVVQSQ